MPEYAKEPIELITLAQQVGGNAGAGRTAVWSLWIERLAKRGYRQVGRSLLQDCALLTDRVLAVAHHYAGNQGLARQHVERVLGGGWAVAIDSV